MTHKINDAAVEPVPERAAGLPNSIWLSRHYPCLYRLDQSSTEDVEYVRAQPSPSESEIAELRTELNLTIDYAANLREKIENDKYQLAELRQRAGRAEEMLTECQQSNGAKYGADWQNWKAAEATVIKLRQRCEEVDDVLDISAAECTRLNGELAAAEARVKKLVEIIDAAGIRSLYSDKFTPAEIAETVESCRVRDAQSTSGEGE